mmetsp:Transcript_2952/g.9301  ORF Transcript_2952/g.9301 Transcript_2952/m.9301 type:complete len:222 (+) Transcript_2952:567-1232(+)
MPSGGMSSGGACKRPACSISAAVSSARWSDALRRGASSGTTNMHLWRSLLQGSSGSGAGSGSSGSSSGRNGGRFRIPLQTPPHRRWIVGPAVPMCVAQPPSHWAAAPPPPCVPRPRRRAHPFSVRRGSLRFPLQRHGMRSARSTRSSRPGLPRSRGRPSMGLQTGKTARGSSKQCALRLRTGAMWLSGALARWASGRSGSWNASARGRTPNSTDSAASWRH